MDKELSNLKAEYLDAFDIIKEEVSTNDSILDIDELFSGSINKRYTDYLKGFLKMLKKQL